MNKTKRKYRIGLEPMQDQTDAHFRRYAKHLARTKIFSDRQKALDYFYALKEISKRNCCNAFFEEYY